jgi:hypothetical protein
MHAERTFWEKATAIHVFCLQERLRGDRFSRHWHDIVRLDDIGLSDSAIADRELASAVARHKSMFFAEKAAERSLVDYQAAVSGNLVLTPVGEGRAALEEDYSRMVGEGLLLDDAETLDELLKRCAAICDKAYAAA